jgi:SNF2 family DNA or RNA helicase
MADPAISSLASNQFALDAPAVVALPPLGMSAPGVVSIQFCAMPPKTVGCLFSPFGEDVHRRNPWNGTVRQPKTAPRPIDSEQVTRVRPPRDVVKLEDRLRYLLEPPLETLLAAASLQFVHRPFSYQLDGVAFLYPRHQAVLADEMGLGKTMQAITAIRLLVHQRQVRRVLLVCPKPLVANWQRELALWAPELPVAAIEGNRTRRHWMWQRPEQVVTIANYETLVRDSELICTPDNHYDLVILDEAQRIKNGESVTNQTVRNVPRSRSWALTGTPIENSTNDLVGIFDFVAPGQIDSGMKPRTMARALSDHILRRTKENVLRQLPPKLFRDADVSLTPEQSVAYQRAEEEGVVRLRGLERDLTIQHVFELVLRLKQICNFDPATGCSSKFERLEADLEECVASGRKALVFSQWVQTLMELRTRLARFRPFEFHGNVPSRERATVLDRFRDDPTSHVLLMSYGVGSVGLNLQFASYVFLFDRWWNPAVEDQAINRAHRIGVTCPVTVTRFLTLGTIEERIHRILEEKRLLADTVFGHATAAASLGLTRREILSLFDLEDHQAADAA